MRNVRFHLTCVLILGFGLLGVGQASADIMQNFEGQTAGSSTPPSGWSLVTVAGAPSFVTTAAGQGSDGSGGSSGLAGRVTSTGFLAGRPDLPGAYLVNDFVFDVRHSITGSFDAFLPNDGTFDDFIFVVGDIGTGVTGSSAGELLSTKFLEGGGGSRSDAIANGIGDGTITNRLDTNSAANGFFDDTWYNFDFTWTPTSETEGDFSITLSDFSNPNLVTLSATSFTFDSIGAQIGFGSVNDILVFDNVNIEGTAVPEPSSLAVLGMCGGFMFIRRRKKNTLVG